MTDYEDLYDLDNLDDDEIYDLILQQFEEYGDIDTDLIDIRVEDGFITLGGRVGTEHELQVVEQILTDVLGVQNYSNEVVIADLARTESSEAADEARFEVDAADVVSPLGEGDDKTDPEATHLIENVAGDLYGTHDLQRAIERGQAYEAPDRPLQEGSWSEEDH